MCSPQERKKKKKPCSLESSTEDRGVFEEQTEGELRASSRCRRRTKKKKNQGGEERRREINDKHPLLTSSEHERSSLAELCGGPVATSQQAGAASSLASPLSPSLTLSLSPPSFFFPLFFLPDAFSLRPPVQSKVGSLFMCKFALRPYEGGVHAESLLSGL